MLYMPSTLGLSIILSSVKTVTNGFADPAKQLISWTSLEVTISYTGSTNPVKPKWTR